MYKKLLLSCALFAPLLNALERESVLLAGESLIKDTLDSKVDCVKNDSYEDYSCSLSEKDEIRATKDIKSGDITARRYRIHVKSKYVSQSAHYEDPSWYYRLKAWYEKQQADAK